MLLLLFRPIFARPDQSSAKRWRDELDEYWKGAIWQRIAEDRQMWKQHTETFAQQRAHLLHKDGDDDDDDQSSIMLPDRCF